MALLQNMTPRVIFVRDCKKVKIMSTAVWILNRWRSYDENRHTIKVLQSVKVKPKPKYPPIRKHYNAHLFG